jgi:hypothetical protein
MITLPFHGTWHGRLPNIDLIFETRHYINYKFEIKFSVTVAEPRRMCVYRREGKRRVSLVPISGFQWKRNSSYEMDTAASVGISGHYTKRGIT